MEKALEGNKTIEKLTLSDDDGVTLNDGPTLPREFCHHVLLGSRQNTSLSKVDLRFHPQSWDCPHDGRLVYVRHMLCDSVGPGCSV